MSNGGMPGFDHVGWAAGSGEPLRERRLNGSRPRRAHARREQGKRRGHPGDDCVCEECLEARQDMLDEIGFPTDDGDR